MEKPSSAHLDQIVWATFDGEARQSWESRIENGSTALQDIYNRATQGAKNLKQDSLETLQTSKKINLSQPFFSQQIYLKFWIT